MPKLYKLKEVRPKRSYGTEIIVERIYERVLSEASNDQTGIPLSKIALTDKVINLSGDETFIHPQTEIVFKVLRKSIPRE
ncbi:hypothetical protein ACBQ24_14765 [Acinetobacter terrestris]|uniref:hypothetical protein n=1 Tax=Acinetobacter terrestris TaxID=2529843 RepID=UPI00103EB667|nr:hypothetical protein [Acinetobacter terrestris]TCB53411.1 hypothetical protein E0H84_11825 [Acinetobacter terrestris]